MSRRLVACAEIVVIALCLALYVKDTVVDVSPQLARTNDFGVYHSAGRAIVSGASPYSIDGYIYPPLLAFLLTPLADTSGFPARWIWFVLCQACSLSAAWLLWTRLGRSLDSACLIAVAWAICATCLAEALSLGQVTPVLLLLLVLAYLPSAPASGGAVGLGAAIKLFPAVLLPGLWIARERRRFAWGLGSFLLLSAVPWAWLRAFWPPPFSPPSKTYLFGTPAVLNFSLAGATLRLLDPPTRYRQLPAAWQFGNILQRVHLPLWQGVISLSVVSLVLAFVCILWWKTPRQPYDLLIASFSSLAMAVTPVIWSHYHSLSGPAAAVIAVYALRAGRPYLAVSAGLALCLTYRIPYFLLQSYAAIYPWPSAGKYPAVWYLGTALGGLASLYLALLACWLARR